MLTHGTVDYTAPVVGISSAIVTMVAIACALSYRIERNAARREMERVKALADIVVRAERALATLFVELYKDQEWDLETFLQWKVGFCDAVVEHHGTPDVWYQATAEGYLPHVAQLEGYSVPNEATQRMITHHLQEAGLFGGQLYAHAF